MVFQGKTWLVRLPLKNTNALAEIFEPVECRVKATLYTPSLTAEETVAELTYKKLLKSMEIHSQISLIYGLKEFDLSCGFAVIYLASQMLVHCSNERLKRRTKRSKTRCA